MPSPAEFALAAACCRWPPSEARDAAVREAAAAVDWARFTAVVRRHRVEGLVHDALGRAGVAVPGGLAEALQRSARGIALENLRYAAEAARLRRRLEEAGLPHLFLKGLTLNMLAYATLTLKKSVDLDIVVERASIGAAVDLMEAEGYRAASPHEGASREEVLEYASRIKDTLWLKGGLAVEIHTAFVDSPMMLSGVSLASPRQEVAVASGVVLPTLAKDELYAYLCVHGATHAWMRLKWLADVAALLSREPAGEIERLHRRSIEIGGGRSSAQALLLCADLLALPLPPRLEPELRRDRVVRALVGTALRTMVSGGAVAELDSFTFGTARIHAAHFRLKPGWRFKLFELRRKIRAAGGLAGVPRWLGRRRRMSRAWTGRRLDATGRTR